MIGNFDNSKNQKNTIFDPYPIIHDNIRIWDFTSTQELPTCDFFVLDTQSVHFTKYQCPMTTTNLSHSLSFITFIILYYQSLSFIANHCQSLSISNSHYQSVLPMINHYQSLPIIISHSHYQSSYHYICNAIYLISLNCQGSCAWRCFWRPLYGPRVWSSR